MYVRYFLGGVEIYNFIILSHICHPRYLKLSVLVKNKAHQTITRRPAVLLKEAVAYYAYYANNGILYYVRYLIRQQCLIVLITVIYLKYYCNASTLVFKSIPHLSPDFNLTELIWFNRPASVEISRALSATFWRQSTDARDVLRTDPYGTPMFTETVDDGEVQTQTRKNLAGG